MAGVFPDIRFQGELRPSQADVVKIARNQLDAGERQLHIVAPPGSGKTVTGLYLWAEVIKQPTLVLCPNSAIQSQWAARSNLFSSDGAPLRKDWVSTDPEYPGRLTSLTYQSVTLPSRDDNTLDMTAVFNWVDHLIEKGQAQDPTEAQMWIEKAVGHVHAAFTEIKPEGVEKNMVDLNRDMLERVGQRPHFRSLWKIGEPYHPEPIQAVEKKAGGGMGFKALSLLSQEWTDGTLTQAIGRAVIGGLAEAGLLDTMNLPEAENNISVTERAGGYVRIFLESADEATSRLFAQAMADVFGPVKDARYVIQRQEDFEYSESRHTDTWVTSQLPEFVSEYIVDNTLEKKYRREVVKVHAVPKALARNKERALLFQKHWNTHVSPGNLWFHKDDGTKSMLSEAAENGWLPDDAVRQKEVFL